MVSVGDSQSIVRRTFICALPSQCLSDKFGMSDEVFARRTAGMTEEQLEQARQRSRDHAAQEEGKSATEHIVGWFYPSWGTLYIHGVSYNRTPALCLRKLSGSGKLRSRSGPGITHTRAGRFVSWRRRRVGLGGGE